jgi:hypothetical protein
MVEYEVSPQRLRLGPQLVALLRSDWIIRALPDVINGVICSWIHDLMALLGGGGH